MGGGGWWLAVLVLCSVRCGGVAQFTSVALLCVSVVTPSASLRCDRCAPVIMVMLVVVVVAVMVRVVLVALVLVMVAMVVIVDVVATISSIALGMVLGCLFSGCSMGGVLCVWVERRVGVECACGGCAVGEGWVRTRCGVGVRQCGWCECRGVDVE